MNLEVLSGQDLRRVIMEATSEELHAEFQRGLRLTAEHLTRMAFVLAELESRGEIAMGVEDRLLKLLRRIAGGQVLAKAVVQFAHRPALMQKVTRLPFEEQQRLTDDPESAKELDKPILRRHSPRSLASLAGKGGSLPSNNSAYAAARLASPGDLAEQIIEMIRNNPDPEAVVNKLLALDFVERCTAKPPVRF